MGRSSVACIRAHFLSLLNKSVDTQFVLQEEDILLPSEAQIHEQVSAWTKCGGGACYKPVLTDDKNVSLKDGEAHQQVPQLAPTEANEVQQRQPPRPGREREFHRPLQPIEDPSVGGRTRI